ncbi:iron chelate uptake ABC transporter family permease subunit, partial [Staphylococcus xylosus]
MTTKKKGKLSFTATFIIAVLLLIGALIISILFGDAKIHLSTIFEAVFNYDSKNQQHNIISEIRIPRDIGAILVGVALGTSGAVIQGVTKNGLADPSLIGLNSGASFMLALTFAFYPTAPFLVMMFAGFIGALMGG